MKLPSFSRIIIEELPSKVQEWVGKLIDPLNSFMLTIRRGLDKNLTINDNLSGAIKSVTLNAGSSGAVALQYITSRSPRAVALVYWYDKTDSTWTPTSGIGLKWAYDGKSELSTTFYGFDDTHTYNINLLILDD